jgi:hypothetical protein
MKSYWTGTNSLSTQRENIIIYGTNKPIEVFKASEVRDLIKEIGNTHVKEQSVLCEACVNNHNKGIELRKRWFVHKGLMKSRISSAEAVRLLKEAFTKPIEKWIKERQEASKP